MMPSPNFRGNNIKHPHITTKISWELRKGHIKCECCEDIEPILDVNDVDPTVDLINAFTELHAECNKSYDPKTS